MTHSAGFSSNRDGPIVPAFNYKIHLPESTQLITMIVKPLLKFTTKIFKSFEGEENVVLSPVCIHTALSMLLLGVEEGSRSEKELLEALGLEHLDEEGINKCLYEYSSLLREFKEITEKSQEVPREQPALNPEFKSIFRTSSGLQKVRQQHTIRDIFSMVITKDQGDILPAYEAKIRQYFDSSIVKVDDKKPETKTNLLERLNKWAEEAGLDQPIKERDLDVNFSTILLSAIHVQSAWFKEFHENENESPAFFNQGKNDQPVGGTLLGLSGFASGQYLELTSADKARYKFLHEKLASSNSAKLFDELSALNVQVAQISLHDKLSFTIFEPLHPSGEGGELDELVDQLMQTDETSALSKLERVFSLLEDAGDNPIDSISFPKFCFKSDISLKNHLESIGLKRVFDISTSEISNILDTRHPLHIGQVIHKAMIDVNKRGIKASGYTIMSFGSALRVKKDPPIEVHVRHPFMFCIRHEKLPLFIGRLDMLNK